MTLIVHQAWFNEVPPLIADCMSSWDKWPGLEMRRYGVQDAVDILGIDVVDHCFTIRLGPRAAAASWRNRYRLLSDLFRYKLLASVGGLWADCDTTAIKDPLALGLQNDAGLVLFNPKSHHGKGLKTVCNGLMYSGLGQEPRVIDKIYEKAMSRAMEAECVPRTVGWLTGPHMLIDNFARLASRIINHPYVSKPDASSTPETILHIRYGRHDDAKEVTGPIGWGPKT